MGTKIPKGMATLTKMTQQHIKTLVVHDGETLENTVGRGSKTRSFEVSASSSDYVRVATNSFRSHRHRCSSQLIPSCVEVSATSGAFFAVDCDELLCFRSWNNSKTMDGDWGCTCVLLDGTMDSSVSGNEFRCYSIPFDDESHR